MKKFISFAVAAMLCFSALAPIGQEVYAANEGKNETKSVSIAFMHDMHSHLDSITVYKDGKEQEIGGLAKVKTMKDDLEEKYPGTVLVDAGDFSMGTPFQTVFETDALELKTMGEAGVDVTTFGNHEFDYDVDGLANMLESAAESKEDYTLPTVVGTNIDWEKSLKNKSEAKKVEKLKNAFKEYGVEDYTVIEKNGVRIALFGHMGDDSISTLSGNAELTFTDRVARAKTIIEEIKQNDEADIIVCLSHSGINPENWEESEDVKLAKEVDGIDLIISAHSHDLLKEVEMVGNTAIACAGSFSQNLGHIVLESKGDEWKVKSYKISEVGDNIKEDDHIQNMVEDNKDVVNREFFSEYGYSYDEEIVESDFSFTPIENFAAEQKGDSLGDLLADSYLYAYKKATGNSADVAIVASGTVRDSISKGEVTAADVFNIGSLGQGKDGNIGYPLVYCYLTGAELRDVAEVDASISPSIDFARLYPAGMSYKINDKRLILNRAYDLKIVDKDGKEEKIEDDKMYKVVANLHTANMLGVVKAQSKGLLSIEPKDKKGNIVKDFGKYIVKDGSAEVKEWLAIASYLESFDGEIPSKYKKSQDRKMVESSLNPWKLMKDPSDVAVIVICILLIPVVIIGGIIAYLIKRKHDRRGYSKSVFSSRRSRGYGRRNRVSSRGRNPAIRKRKLNLRGKGRSRF